MDTDSLIFSFKLDLLPFKVIERLESQYHVILPSKVTEEYRAKSRTQPTYEQFEDIRPDVELFLRRKIDAREVISEETYGKCIEHIKKWYILSGRQKEFHRLGEGEKHCLALGLYWNRKYKTPLFIITDDFRAVRSGLCRFVLRQRIGLLCSLPEAMISMYLSTRVIKKVHILGFITDYFHLSAPKKIESKNLKTGFEKEVMSSCREKNIRNCGQSCFV